MQADKIPDEIMREAREIANCFLYPSSNAANECAADIARALMARDKRAAEIARAFADSEEINALAGTASSTGVRSPGWIKDALHSNGADVSNSIATVILTYGGRDEQR